MLARVDNDQVQEFRPITLEDVPEHKRYLWRPVVEEGDGDDRQIKVEADLVRITRTPRPQRVKPEPAPDPYEARIAALEARVTALIEAVAAAGAK